MKSKAYNAVHKSLGGIVRFIFRIHSHTAENEPDEADGPYILVSNHISNPDPVLLCAVLKKQQPHFMAKKELFKVPLLSSLIRALGAYPVNRGNGDVSAIKNSIKMLEEGRCIGIFPQGHRRKGVDPRTTEVKNGAAMIAAHSNATILPCYIKTRKNKLAFLSRVDIYVGKPIRFEELGYDPDAKGEYSRMSRIIFDRICELGDDKNGEI